MRERWIDNTKGILIILVVLGHILPPPYAVLSTPASYIFLFHMPAFFMVSGYLANPKKRTLPENIWGKTKRVLGPYFFYLVLIAGTQIIFHYIKMPRTDHLQKELYLFLWGGQHLNYFRCGALWFLTCSFFIYIFFYLIEKLPKGWMRAGVYIGCWVLAHYQSHTISPWKQASFWLWDVAIIGVVYLAIGYYFKKYLFDKRVFVGAIVCVVGFFAVRALDLVSAWRYFGIELWSHTYKYPVFDMVLPCGIFVIIANLVNLIPEGKISAVLSELGKYSLAIMSMHQMVMYLMMDVWKIRSIFVVLLVATIVPYLIVRFIWSKIPGIRKISF